MLKASLNSWIWDWSNMAKTFDVALWGRFLVVLALARLLDILASGVGASLQEEVWDDDDGHLVSRESLEWCWE